MEYVKLYRWYNVTLVPGEFVFTPLKITKRVLEPDLQVLMAASVCFPSVIIGDISYPQTNNYYVEIEFPEMLEMSLPSEVIQYKVTSEEAMLFSYLPMKIIKQDASIMMLEASKVLTTEKYDEILGDFDIDSITTRLMNINTFTDFMEEIEEHDDDRGC